MRHLTASFSGRTHLWRHQDRPDPCFRTWIWLDQTRPALVGGHRSELTHVVAVGETLYVSVELYASHRPSEFSPTTPTPVHTLQTTLTTGYPRNEFHLHAAVTHGKLDQNSWIGRLGALQSLHASCRVVSCSAAPIRCVTLQWDKYKQTLLNLISAGVTCTSLLPGCGRPRNERRMIETSK